MLKQIAAEMVDKPDSRGRDNPAIPAGYTYFGQFVEHDITFDTTSALGRLNDPDALVDFRTAVLLQGRLAESAARPEDRHEARRRTDQPARRARRAARSRMRNLRRGKALRLPPGLRVARTVGATELRPREMGRNNPVPLWFYILKEAEVRDRGARLGTTGARIVGETLIGLLAADPLSYFSVEPTWRPKLPAATAGDFTMADLVRFATS